MRGIALVRFFEDDSKLKIHSEITQPLTISLSTLADKSRGRISSSTIKTGAKVFLGGTTSEMEKLIKALFSSNHYTLLFR